MSKILKLENFRSIFLLTSFIGALLIASPVLTMILPSSSPEKFSELYVLGSNHMAGDYPFNVEANETYRLFLGIRNHMGSSTYYVLYVKLRNQSESLPDLKAGKPSSLPPLYEYPVFLGDGELWEVQLNFAFKGILLQDNNCKIETLTVNGLDLHANKMVSWNSENQGYDFELFFELWIYDSKTKDFCFHNRFVTIRLNMRI